MAAKRVALYLRVSTDGQTVENQRLALQSMAQHRAWEIVDEFIDKGISGAKGRDKRPPSTRCAATPTVGSSMW